MISKKEYIRMWQNRVGVNTSHLYIEKLDERTLGKLFQQYEKITNLYSLENKKIIDLGCGGGLFNTFLTYENIRLKKYIGLDIAPRCILTGKENNIDKVENGEAEFEIIDPFNFHLDQYKNTYLLIVLNVVQYLPDMQYTKLFFDRLNRSKAKNLYVHFKKGNDKFKPTPYRTTADCSQACFLKIATVLNLLPNYERVKIHNKENDCYISFRLKKEEKIDKDIKTIEEADRALDNIVNKEEYAEGGSFLVTDENKGVIID